MKINSRLELYLKLKQKPFLFSAQISLTNRCNEDCIHCIVYKKPIYELDTTNVKNIISELRELNCMEVIFTGGEPMLREDFFEILNFAKGKGLGIRIFSNGTTINEMNIKQLKEINPLNIQISLYGSTAKTHDSITSLKGSFRMTMNALKLLEKYKISFSVATIGMWHNFHELSKIKYMAENQKIELILDFIIRPRYDGDRGSLKNRIRERQIKKAKNLCLLPFVTKTGILKKYKKDDLCIYKIGKYHVFISNTGEVFPHAAIMIKIGDLRKDSLQNIWYNSEALNRLRNLALPNFECSKCKYIYNCRWDPGLSLAEHNDLFKRPKELCRFMKHITGE